jgi:acyl-CoA reductase-like NAD-dependent aldehyde dehydrogenase
MFRNLADYPNYTSIFNQRHRDRLEGYLAEARAQGADVIMHVSMEDLTFGGVGHSWIRSYHGGEGFKTFSHARAVLKQSEFDVAAMMRPPYGEKIHNMVKRQIKR